MGKKKELEDPALRQFLSEAVMELLTQCPCMGAITAKLPLEEKVELPFPMAVDDKHIYYSPTLLEGWDLPDIKFVIMHEDMHYVQEAHIRIKEYMQMEEATMRLSEEGMMYNIAQDLAINSILILDGWAPPKKFDMCIPGRKPYEQFPMGKDTEWYFDQLRKKKKEQDEKQKPEDGDDKPEQKPEDGDDSGSDDEGEDADNGEGDDGKDSPEEAPDGKRNKGKGKGKKSGNSGSGGSGEGDGDEEGDGEPQKPLREMTLEEVLENLDKLGYDIMPGSEEGTEGDVKSTIAVALNYDAGGHQNQYMKRKMAEELQPPTISWQRQLRRFLTAREQNKTTYARLSRRRDNSRMLFPSRGGHTLGNVALVCDTSGSMLHVLPPIAVECYSLVTAYPKSKFWIIMTDTAVRHTWELGKGKKVPPPKEWEFKGLGGTELSPGFRRAEELHADVMIVPTDLCFCGYPPKPRIPVIWVVPIRNITKYTNPPYGTVIAMDDSAYRKGRR